ncbi:PadR family transcriptional regulator [Deinococcus sp.]|uniref:PadR family transcriptional regulator n=1 Tax=Deinococcus sp. TaxID=47478 RepID=UPI003C7D5DF4
MSSASVRHSAATRHSADAGTTAPGGALGPSSYIVLGLLSQCGPGTSYDLKRWADESVGYFWTFPRSQLYAEPKRLAALGLLAEAQEAGGRRRRTYRVSSAGQAALQGWLAQPAGFPELRDLGLLKLFFSEQGDIGGVPRLAAEQLALHRARLEEYEQLRDHLPGSPTELLPLRMGLLYERASVAFWTELLG